MTKRGKVKTGKNGEILVQRFSPIRQIEHWLVAVGFILLVVTGFPQKFPTSDVGHFIVRIFGGIEITRLVHRVAGIVFCVQAAFHILAIVIGGLTRRMRMTMMPTAQDVRDAWEMLRYYLAKRETKPPLPKFDYRQKFEYLGMVLGGLIMIFSGLALMYPVFIIKWLPLPGQLILVAEVLHSSEAMLALFVLLVWHVYGASLNPEVFPIDKTMFTGYMTAEELHHHHQLEYEYVFGPEGHHPGGGHGHGHGGGGSGHPAPRPAAGSPAGAPQLSPGGQS
jgi:formate dehydrogenase gamma subunit